ncbi:alpha/beta hydrolase [Paenibacillus flagellatus]|uniref:Alpha/beta hydrolase n=1 Tax=Paenibacillus flagellatus TaxID=2211139 RepID=A0A2V5KAY6_9BACL|nr:alpha/beta hydrolase [Paenibacillus flagellatus]PYI56678.1 alpha/beta hydrolase [Paenibacillus flagellatus]
MNVSRQRLPDGLLLHEWEPGDPARIRGAIHLVHGSCEHAERYDHFARYLVGLGFAVYAADLRGHGGTAPSRDELGYFGEDGGWDAMVEDLHRLTRHIRAKRPGVPVVMLGHSMGSFLARHYAIVHGMELDGLIAVGTAHHPRLLLRSAVLTANTAIRRKGSRYRSKLLYKLSYGAYNRRFRPARTPHDWLTRDEAEVDRFVRDERCGFVLTAAGFRDMFEGLRFITDSARIRETPKTLPVLLLSGKDDPVGGYGAMPERAYAAYRQAGLTDVRLKLYDGMRHEILNEIGKEDVYRDIADWLDRIVTSRREK